MSDSYDQPAVDLDAVFGAEAAPQPEVAVEAEAEAETYGDVFALQDTLSGRIADAANDYVRHALVSVDGAIRDLSDALKQAKARERE